MITRTINRFLRNSYIKPNYKTLLGKFADSATKSHSSSGNSWKVVFYGTDELSEVTLKALNTNRLSKFPEKVIDSLHVVCVKTDCLVRRYASLNNLTIHTWPYCLPTDTYDVGVVVSFGHLIPSENIFACKYGIINAHPSLLPRWRGAAPIFHSILNGDVETGVTITQVSPNKFDVGKILLQETYRIPDECTTVTLTKILSEMAADMVLRTLKKLPEYIKSSYSQPDEGVIYAPKIKPHKCNINWDHDTMTAIQRKLNAFEGHFDVFTYWKEMKVAILKCLESREVESAKVSSLISHPISPGFCYFHKRRKVLFVKCEHGWCGIIKLKIPKKGEITALDFYNGFMSKENPKECYFVSIKNKDSLK